MRTYSDVPERIRYGNCARRILGAPFGAPPPSAYDILQSAALRCTAAARVRNDQQMKRAGSVCMSLSASAPLAVMPIEPLNSEERVLVIAMQYE